MLRLTLALLALAAQPAAQAAAAPAAGGGAEAEAWQHKARADYRAAGAAFRQLLAGAEGDARAAALAEFHAVMALHMAQHTGGFDELRRVADAVRTSPFGERHPTLADRLAAVALQCDLATGNLEGIAARTAAMAFLDAWWIAGPFDNERGSGYARVDGPERGLDLDARYDGKERPVAWRPLPVAAPPAGRIDLDALLRPNDQVLCYCATALVSDRERQVLLHLGCDEAFAVFLNGVRIAGRDVRRRFAPDQDVIPLPLRAGPNLLLLKICDQEGSYSFAARLTDEAHRPLTGVVASGDRQTLAAAAAATPSPVQPPPPFLGARSLLAESVEAGGDPWDAVRLAYLLATARADGDRDRRDHDLARRAVAALPDSTSARYLLALTRARADASAADRDDNAQRHDYLAILRAEPEHAQARLALAQLDLELGAAERAERLLQRALEIDPDCDAARLALAEALRARGLGLLADREVERAAKRPQPLPDALLQHGRGLAARGDLRGAAPFLSQALAARYDGSLAVELAELQLRIGARDAAVALLTRAQQLSPFDSAPRLRLARLLEAEGDLQGAAATIRGWLDICPEDDGALVDLSRLCGIAGEVEQQRQALRAATALAPHRRSEQRYLEFLEAGEQPFFAAYELDRDDVLRADPGPPADASAANDAYYYVLDATVVQAHRDGTTSHYRHRIFRILTEEGARRLDSWGVSHFPGEQRARLLSVAVVKPDGRVLQPRLRGAFVDLPPLAIGDVVEVRERVDDLAPSYFGDYFGLQHSLAPDDGAPCRRAQLHVILAPGREYRFQESGGAPPAQQRTGEGGELLCTWEMRDVPRTVVEPRRPSRAETSPLVRITTFRDWQELAAWWWHLIRDQIEVSPSMRAKVRELTAGLPDEASKIAALYRFVTTEIRYTAWEFGVHGYKPYSTAVIFERRHGDCKDKALLLGAMLGEIGVAAHPVLIRAQPLRSRDDLSLAMLQHFNHCICFVPPAPGRPGRFLDGTATYHPVDTLPEADQGADVVVVERGKAVLLEVPWVDARDNRVERSWQVTLAENGDARVVLRERPQRNQAVPLREMLANEPAKRRESIERWLTSEMGRVSVHQVRCSDPLDDRQPIELDVELSAPGLAAVQGSALVLRGTLTARDLAPLVRAPSRQLALLLGAPRSEVDVLHYRLPAGHTASQLPADVELDTPFGHYRLAWIAEPGGVRVERSLALTTNRIEPADYPAFRDFALRASGADAQRVVTEREGSR